MVLRVGGSTLFGVSTTLSIALGLPFGQDPKSGITIFTHNIYTQGKILK
jgi:hypothetical protein